MFPCVCGWAKTQRRGSRQATQVCVSPARLGMGKSESSRSCLQLCLGWSATRVWRPLQIQLPRPWPSSPGGVFPLTCALYVWQSEWSEESSFPCRGLRPHIEAQLGQRGCHRLLLPSCSLSIPGCWKIPRAKQKHTVSGQCRFLKGGWQSMISMLFVKTLFLPTVSVHSNVFIPSLQSSRGSPCSTVPTG